jgi:hypothetical protein
MFKTSQSGVSYIASPGSVSMYKVHASRDFVVFDGSTGAFNLTWRNMENSCPNSWPPAAAAAGTAAGAGVVPPVKVGPANVSTLVFMYVWPANADELTYGGVPAAEFGRARAAPPAAPTLATRLAAVRAAGAVAGGLSAAEEDAAAEAVLAGRPAVAAALDAYAGADAAVVARRIRAALAA